MCCSYVLCILFIYFPVRSRVLCFSYSSLVMFYVPFHLLVPFFFTYTVSCLLARLLSICLSRFLPLCYTQRYRSVKLLLTNIFIFYSLAFDSVFCLSPSCICLFQFVSSALFRLRRNYKFFFCSLMSFLLLVPRLPWFLSCSKFVYSVLCCRLHSSLVL